jgi:hypothetical protein
MFSCPLLDAEFLDGLALVNDRRMTLNHQGIRPGTGHGETGLKITLLDKNVLFQSLKRNNRIGSAFFECAKKTSPRLRGEADFWSDVPVFRALHPCKTLQFYQGWW